MPVLRVPETAFVAADTAQSGVLIDAESYYRTLYRACECAERYVLISGWQFETGFKLLRGEDERNATRPVKFLDFLNALCDERPELQIFLLAWKYSFVYSHDREPEQKAKFTAKNSRIAFEWDAHPALEGSHHQKFVVVDGALAFLGGIDLCDARWDDCQHRAENTERVNVTGDPCKPYHDVQACFTGPLVQSVSEIFCERWGRATDRHLELPPASTRRFDLGALSGDTLEPIRARHTALSRTQLDSRAESGPITEIRSLFAAAIASAEKLIYAETQYFTSRTVARLLIERLRDESRSKLEIVIVLPHGADTAMEKLALGEAEDGVLSDVLSVARATGHEMRLLYPASRTATGSEMATFIHSKILIVDDRLLMVGSPNWTERSVALDTELALSWECTEAAGESACVRRIRCRLLSEHSGVDAAEFERISGLCAKLTAFIDSGRTRLRRREVGGSSMLGVVLGELFDPAAPEAADGR